jgi:tripartite-type tricarboxylate transporter receptor subunit TctC
MTVNRRQMIAAGVAAAMLPTMSRNGFAQTKWPTRSIRTVVGYPAGGQTDQIARAYSEFLTRHLGQPVVVDNKPGAGGTVGAVEVKRAPPDGYTLMCTISTTLIFNRRLIKNLPYDPDNDFVLFSAIPGAGLPLVASHRSGVTNLKEFVDYARKAEKFNFGTYAAGSTAHMAAVELNKQFGLHMEPVHYRGEAPMWADLAGQSIDAAVGSYGAALPVLDSGRGRIIGIVGGKRVSAIPDAPTLKEQGATSKLFEMSGFTGWGVPTGTPLEIVKQLSDAMLLAGKDSKVQDALRTLSLGAPLDYETTQAMYKKETPVWLDLMDGMGIQPG